MVVHAGAAEEVVPVARRGHGVLDELGGVVADVEHAEAGGLWRRLPVLPVLRYRMGPVTQYLVQDSDGLEILVVGTFHELGVPRLVQSLVGQ